MFPGKSGLRSEAESSHEITQRGCMAGPTSVENKIETENNEYMLPVFPSCGWVTLVQVTVTQYHVQYVFYSIE